MPEEIIIGTEGRGKGIYCFPWRSSHPKNATLSKDAPDLELVVEDQEGEESGKGDPKRAPRALAAVDKEIFSITREHIFCLKYTADGGPTIATQRKLQELLPDYDLGPIVDKVSTHGQVMPYGEGFFLSIYNPGVQNPSKTNGQEPKKNSGYLLHAPSRSLDSLISDQITVLKDIHDNPYQPSGPLLRHNEGVYVPCGKNLHKINPETFEPIGSPLMMNGSILAVAALEDILLCADDKGGFLLSQDSRHSDEEYQQLRNRNNDYDPFINNYENGTRGPFLPSRADSVALIRGNPERGASRGKIYALFGCNNGHLVVQEVEIFPDKAPEVRYRTTLSLLSQHRIISQENKDNYVKHIQNIDGLVCFTLRNLFFEFNRQVIINNNGERISGLDELKPEAHIGDYLENLKRTYGTEQICQVPSRISCGCVR